jgi:hypothetical protein
MHLSYWLFVTLALRNIAALFSFKKSVLMH